MKKVLIITYKWPPSGGIGVLRCLKFAKYLRHFGWEPIVYTAKNADYPYYDESNFKDIPNGIKVLKYPIREPFKIFKLLTGRKNTPLNNIFMVRDKKAFLDKFAIWIRANFFIPDARSLWISPSVIYLSKYLEDNKVDAILTDGPPHTNTVIGLKLSKKFNIPFIADFQDPWTQVDYYKVLPLLNMSDKKHKFLEQQVFNQAKQISIASPTWKKDLENIGARNVSVLYYGYDEDDFISIPTTPDIKFSICHSGILGYDRNPKMLFKAIASLSDEIEGFRENTSIKIIGQVGFEINECIKNEGLSDILELKGTVSREISLKEITSAWCLLLPINKSENAKGRMPGKFYEYIRAQRPILCLGPENGDVANIIREYGIGISCEYDNFEKIKFYLKNLYLSNFIQKSFNPVKAKKDISFFSNKAQTSLLADLLNKAIDS